MRKTIVREDIRLETRFIDHGKVGEWESVEKIKGFPNTSLQSALSLASQGRIAEAIKDADFSTNTPSIGDLFLYQFRCVVTSEVIYGDPAYPSTAEEGRK